MEKTEIDVRNIVVHGKDCSGCKRHEKAIMLTYIENKEGAEIIDLFLTQEQAEGLILALSKNIKDNLKD